MRTESAEPLIAPPDRAGWSVSWSSEDPRYGGGGTATVDDERDLRVPGHAGLLIAPGARVG